MRKPLVIGGAAIVALAVAAIAFVWAFTSGRGAGAAPVGGGAGLGPASAGPSVAGDAAQTDEGGRILTPEEQDIIRRMFAPAGAPAPAPAPAPPPAAAPQWPAISPTPEQRAHLDTECERRREQMRRAGRGEKPPRSAEDLD